jgi:hypothetical protein
MFPPSRIEIPRDSTLADTYSIPFAVDYTRQLRHRTYTADQSNPDRIAHASEELFGRPSYVILRHQQHVSLRDCTRIRHTTS